MDLLSCHSCAELWRLPMFLGASEIPHWRLCGLRRGRRTFGGCRCMVLWWCMVLCPLTQEGKRRRAGAAHIRLFSEQVPEELHLALGHPDAGPGCQDSSARLWMQGQELPSLFDGRKYGRHMSVTLGWLLFPKTSEILWQGGRGVGSAGRV